MPKKTTPEKRLPALVIPLMQDCIEGDIDDVQGGLGIRHTENPWVVYLINPKDGVGAGSLITLHFGNPNVVVSSTQIRIGEEDLDLIPLAVPLDLVREYFVNPVFAKLRRSSGNTSETERLKLRVLLARPGDYDPDYSVPGHQGLVMAVPPEVLLYGVDEAVALLGIEIIIRHWEHMNVYDLIVLAWGSQRVLHRVQPGEVGRDITVTVDYATINAAGNGHMTRVAYQPQGATGNLPDERSRWSAVELIDVHLNEQRPFAPYLAYPNTHEDRINLAELGSADAQIDTWVTQNDFNAYSAITLIWRGIDSDENSIPHTETRDLVRPGVYSFYIPNALVEAIARGRAIVYALYQGNGLPDLPSDKLSLDIFGEITRWPAPQIKEDLGGYLNPAIAATVYFPLQSSWPGDGLLEVIVRVSSPDGTIEHRVGREVDDTPPINGYMEFTVYPDELGRFVGYRVEVFYMHTRPGGRPQESLRLAIAVGEIRHTMPAPFVEKAIGGQLNPDDIGAYAKVCSTFTETKRADWIRMYWNGPRARTMVAVQVAVDGDTTVHEFDKVFVLDNLNESVGVSYTLTRGIEPPRYSVPAEVLISRDLGELLLPVLLGAKITGANTAELAPLDVQQGTKVVVTYLGMLNRDSIQVIVVGAGTSGSPIIPPMPGNEASQKVEFDITSAAIAANIGDKTNTTFTLRYEVTRNGQTKRSATLTVTVTPMPVSALPQVIINRVPHNGLLDLNTIIGNPLAIVLKWPFIAIGQRVWITLSASGYVSSPVLTNYSILPSELSGLTNKPVSRNWLQQIPPDHPISVDIKVTLDGSGDISRAVSFTPTIYKVKRVAGTPDTTNFSNNNWNGWVNTRLSNGVLINSGAEGYWRGATIVNANGGLYRIFADGYFIATNTYEISFDYRHEFGANGAKLEVIRYTNPSEKISNDLNASAVWTNVKIRVSFAIVADASIFVYFRMDSTTIPLSVDNIVIRAL